MIDAVIFDFGRVITTQKPMDLFLGYEAELGLPPGRLNRVMFGSEAWQETLLGQRSLDEYWSEIGPRLGLDSEAETQSFRQRYFGDETVNQEVLAIIHKLYGRYKLAVLSNAPPRLSEWLADWQILDLFDVVVCSGDEGLVKPDPAIFELTLTRLGVSPKETIFVDDTLRHVTAARSLGIHGIHFSTANALQNELEPLLTLT